MERPVPADAERPGLSCDGLADGFQPRRCDGSERECTAAGRRSLFAVLKPSLGSDAGLEGYASLGARLGMSETAVKTAAHRLRQRFGELIQEEVEETVGSHEDWQEELRYLIELMGKS